MSKLLLVDGSNLLFQMFYGMPSRIVGKNGFPIHGVIGFVGALLKIIRRVSPTHVAVLFDGEHENGRAELDADYKANRPNFCEMPDEETPFSQLPYIYAALDSLNISHAETETCETDDWVAAYVQSYEETEVVISSFDSDFFQLISGHVSVLRYRGDNTVICTPAYLIEKFGVLPCQYADFKSLVGDTADNIRGADKIGPKTAAALLATFGDLEAIIEHANDIQKPSVRDSVIRNTERLRVNQRLITLTGNSGLPLPFSLEELAWHGEGMTTGEVLQIIGLR